MDKREWIEQKIGNGILDGMDDDCYEFFYKAMHDLGIEFTDADRWAWLNTLFRYEISDSAANEINNWLYENGQDALELDSKSKSTLEMICVELGIKLDFSKFVLETPKAIRYTWN